MTTTTWAQLRGSGPLLDRSAAPPQVAGLAGAKWGNNTSLVNFGLLGGLLLLGELASGLAVSDTFIGTVKGTFYAAFLGTPLAATATDAFIGAVFGTCTRAGGRTRRRTEEGSLVEASCYSKANHMPNVELPLYTYYRLLVAVCLHRCPHDALSSLPHPSASARRNAHLSCSLQRSTASRHRVGYICRTRRWRPCRSLRGCTASRRRVECKTCTR